MMIETAVAVFGTKFLVWCGGLIAVGLAGLATAWVSRRSGEALARDAARAARSDDDAKALKSDDGVRLSDAELLRRLHQLDDRK